MDQNKPDILIELEHDVQRYMQLREELKGDIDLQLQEIKIHTLELGDATKRFIAHFNIFKTLSDTSAKKISHNIENAANKMADRAADGFSKAVDEKVNNAIERLNQSVWKASRELQYVTHNKTWRNLAIAGLSCMMCLSVGFSAGYFFVPPQTVEVSETTLETLNHGRLMEAAWLRLTKTERDRILKLAKNRRR